MFTHTTKNMLNDPSQTLINTSVPFFLFDSLQLHMRRKWEPP